MNSAILSISFTQHFGYVLSALYNAASPARFEYTILKIEGRIRSVKSVEVISPPITTVANGFWVSEPIPVDNAAGSNPSIAINAVIKTGRTLVKAPLRTASAIFILA